MSVPGASLDAGDGLVHFRGCTVRASLTRPGNMACDGIFLYWALDNGVDESGGTLVDKKMM